MLLGKIKIHEIAKKLGLTSKEILERAEKLNIEAKSHLSGINEEEAKMIEDSFLSKKEKTQKVEAKTSKEQKNKEKETTNKKL